MRLPLEQNEPIRRNLSADGDRNRIKTLASNQLQKTNKMKNTITALVLTVCMSTLALGAEPIEYVPTPGESATVASPIQEEASTGFSVEIFPKEIYLGDAIYLIVYLENRSDNDVVIDPLEYSSIQFSLSASSVSSKYTWIPEYRTNALNALESPPRTMEPGEKIPIRRSVLEFPPLEDWNDQFWQPFRQLLATKRSEESIDCKLSIEHGFVTIEHDVLVKRRPEHETALLEQWFNDTPKTLFPRVDGNRKVPYRGLYLEPSGKSNIQINGKEYDPWTFVRFAFRKPSDPNNPTTLEGWRDLEASLTPSTMRDEIRLTRLQLEYYAAEPGEPGERAKTELVDWLKSLPEIQRTRMTSFLVSKTRALFDSSLRDKNRELMRALYDVLDVRSQEIVCNFESLKYNDYTLTPPPGVNARTPFEEVIKPAPEDLAHGSKDLPDGFRIWDVAAKSSPRVAQYVELQESEDSISLKARNGFVFNMRFSALSEEDQEHARAMSQAAAAKPEG